MAAIIRVRDQEGNIINIPAIRGPKGDQGLMVSNVTFENNQITIYLNDGTSFTSPSVKGDTGEKGDTGNGIASITLESGEQTPGGIDQYKITFTNGETYTYSIYNGKDGREITSIELEEGDHTPGTIDEYIIYFNDGDSFNFPVYNGKDGTEIESVTLESGDHSPGSIDRYKILLTNGESYIYPVYNGTSTHYVSIEPPDDTNLLWIDISGDDPVLKYNNGVEWTDVAAKQSPPYIASDSPPEDTGTFWINTSKGNIMNFYDAASESWKIIPSAWG